MAILCLPIFLLSLLIAEQKTITLNEVVEDISKLKVNCDYNGGDIIFSSSDSQFSLNAYIQYEKTAIETSLNYEKIGKTGIFDMEAELLSNFDFSFNSDKKNVSSQVLLPEKIPAKLNLDIGMSDLELDLEKVLISGINLDFGMGDGIVHLGKGAPERDCKSLDIDIGMGSMEIKNIGEFDCKYMEFEVGMGSLTLEYSNHILQDLDFDISVGLGSVSILVPRSVNVKFLYDQNILSDVDLDEMVLVDNDTYRNENFNKGNPILTFSASVGMGSLSLNWVD